MSCNRGPDCRACAANSKNRRAPYATNPARRLRRLKRWLSVSHVLDPNSIHAWHWPKFTQGPRWPSDAVQGLANKRRISMAKLMKVELEWACKTATESIGGEW